ncbi:MAG TPA: nucleotidyltransferase domain-containing protein [Opitutaceae bacterium]|nr:nucleotidyltransferase domain-containing protein [Opitutaceae bacterium]
MIFLARERRKTDRKNYRMDLGVDLFLVFAGLDALLEALRSKIAGEPPISAALLFGSRARGQASPSSDVDLQVVVREPARVASREWLSCGGQFDLVLFSQRRATGGATKVTALYSSGIVDLVLPRYPSLVLARLLVKAGAHRRWKSFHEQLQALSIIIRPGFQVLKGGSVWESFYRRVAEEVVPARIDDTEALERAQRCYLDAYWAYRKARDGELLAAQRWLHRVPFETNVDLLNELRLRQGLRPCYDARRSETQLSADELRFIRLETTLDPETLCGAALTAVENTRQLVKALTGKEPIWPRF